MQERFTEKSDNCPVDKPVITRSEAKDGGLIRYFTGKPCPHGHLVERFTSIAQCVECGNLNSKRWKAANPDRVLQYAKDWAADNPDKVRINARMRAQNNPEKNCQNVLRWQRENPEKVRAKGHNRRALEWGASGTHTASEVEALAEMQKHRCAYCCIPITPEYRHKDHFVPLSRGGSNDIGNIRLTCAPCNLRKGDSLFAEWQCREIEHAAP